MSDFQPRDRRRLRPLNRKDWPSFSEDKRILNEYPYEEFLKLSPRKQYKKELALMGKLYGSPYENCHSIIFPLLYDEGDKEKPTYLWKLMHKCWKMGAFDPCRLYLRDRQEIYDVGMTEDEEYSSSEGEYSDSGSESEEEGWSDNVHLLRSGHRKEAKKGVDSPKIQKYSSRQRPVKKELDIREEDRSPGSKGFTKSLKARESSSKLLNSGASRADKKTSKSTKKARSSVGPIVTRQESSKTSPSSTPTQDPAPSKSKRRTAKTTLSTISPSRPQTPVPNKREHRSPSESRSSKVEKASEPIPGKPQKVNKPNTTHHRARESGEVDPAVDDKVTKVSSKKRSQGPESCEPTSPPISSINIPNVCERKKDNEYVKRDKNRKVSLSATSNSAPKTKRDRDVKPLPKSSREKEVDLPNDSGITDSSHSFVNESSDAAPTTKDTKPYSVTTEASGLDGLDILGSIDIQLPKPINSSGELAKAGAVPAKCEQEELAPDPQTARVLPSDAMQAKRDRKIKPLPKSRRTRIAEKQIDPRINDRCRSLIEESIPPAPIQKETRSYSETIAVSKSDEEGDIGPLDIKLATTTPSNGELTRVSPALANPELDKMVPVPLMSETSMLKAQPSGMEAPLSVGQHTQRPFDNFTRNDHEEYDLTILCDSSGNNDCTASRNETQEQQNLMAEDTAIYSSSGIDDLLKNKPLTSHEFLQTEDQASRNDSCKELSSISGSLLVSDDVNSGIFEVATFKQTNHTETLVPFIRLCTPSPLTARRVSDIGLKKNIASYFFE